MNKDERNRIMDDILRWSAEADIKLRSGESSIQAIRECDRLARAWDKLDHWLFFEHCGPVQSFQGRDEVRKKMTLLLAPPAPKDPLEELEEFVKREQAMAIAGVHSANTLAFAMLAEIRRLRGKEGKK